MKLQYIVALVSVLMLTSMVYAHSGELDLESIDLEKLVGAYNQNLDKVPGFVKNIFGNERINLYMDGGVFVGLSGENGKIVEYKKGAIDKPTMKVYTTHDTIDDLIDGNTTLLDAVKDKSISYEGVGFFGKVKFGFIKIFQGIFLRK